MAENTEKISNPFFKLTLLPSKVTAAPITFLANSVKVDYFLYRQLYLKGNFNMYSFKLIKTTGDFIEKLLKTFLLSYDESVDQKKLGHKLELIRVSCSEIDDYYNKPDLITFCQEYSQVSNKVDGHQIFGYSDFSVFAGATFDFERILDLLDELFVETIRRMRASNGFIYYDLFGIYLKNPFTIQMNGYDESSESIA